MEGPVYEKRHVISTYCLLLSDLRASYMAACILVAGHGGLQRFRGRLHKHSCGTAGTNTFLIGYGAVQLQNHA